MGANLSDSFDAIIVGTGFGGGAAARQLAAHGLKVLILERGRLYPPGSFPRHPKALSRNVWDPSEALYGMFDLWRFRSMDALVSSGVGGGSLIYANVLIRKPDRWFVQNGADGEDWPIDAATLAPHYAFIERELDAQNYPFAAAPYDKTSKTKLLQDAARQLHLKWVLPHLAVSFSSGAQPPAPGLPLAETGPNLHGRPRTTCTLCGECDIGCNQGAKNTVDLTLLSRAVADGAQLRPLAEVKEIEPLAGGGYEVTYRDLSAPESRGAASVDTDLVSVRAKIVMVCAGTLGSTYLLLNNRGRLPGLSDALGTRFSGNGDFLAFVSGKAAKDSDDGFVDPSFGPVITSTIEVPDRLNDGLGRGYYIQDGGLPLFATWLIEATQVLPFLRRLAGFAWDYLSGLWSRSPRSRMSGALGTVLGRGADRSWSLPLLGMGRDVAGGRMGLRGDYLDVDWPSLPSRRYFVTLKAQMRSIALAVGARLTVAPLWFLRRTITVHALGGCPMGRTAQSGVVDDCGEAFGHKGLFVADGSAMPGPVGANPSLTIAAFANRSALAAIARHFPDKARTSEEFAQ